MIHRWKLDVRQDVTDFIRAQVRVIREAIDADLKRLEARGTKATYPLVAQIQGAVYELRTQVDGYGFFRLFYYQNGPTSFCVFDKYQKGSKRLPGRVKKRVLTRYTDLTGKKA